MHLKSIKLLTWLLYSYEIFSNNPTLDNASFKLSSFFLLLDILSITPLNVLMSNYGLIEIAIYS